MTRKTTLKPARLKPAKLAVTRLTSMRFKPGVRALALGIPTLLMSGASFAQSDDPFVLDTLKIEERTVDTNPYSEADAPYKAKVSGDSRHVKDLADTPQTINVLTQTQIQESGKSDLRDVLAAQPGITLGTGENGNAFGDRYIIRGHEARSDVFVDGLRDPGMTTRESFATEQVEITKGPSSTFAGRGSTGGAINSITKQASTEYDFNKVSGGIGTDNYQRLSLDSNNSVSDDIALRVNLLYSLKDVPDRTPADKSRRGVALSGLFQATEKLQLLGDLYYLNAEDSPDLGTYIVSGGGKPVDDFPVYLQEQDFIKSAVSVATLRAKYVINETSRIENALRYGTTDNGYVTTGARGTNRDATDPDAPGAETASLSTHQGWQEVGYFVNQFNFFKDMNIAGKKNQLVIGVELSKHNVVNGVYNVANNGSSNCIVSGRGGAGPGYCTTDANGNTPSNINTIMGRSITKGDQDSDYNIETISLSVMDTIELSEDWSLFTGIRLDDFDYDNTVDSRGTIVDFKYSDTIWNGHIGAAYKINDDANVYLNYSTSANINGGESDVGGNCGYGGLCGDPEQVANSEPEMTANIELGTKWNILNDKLLATAAIFQITKSDVMESVGDDYATLGTLNTGKNRVQGIEFSLVGNISSKLSTQFGASFMESEILESYNTDTEGKVLSNFADDSVFLQLRYQASPKFSFGGTLTYSGELYAGQPDSAAGFSRATGNYSYEVPSYKVFDAFASYQFSEQLKARINIGNVTDEDYYLTAYRSGAFTYIGEARNAHLSVDYEL
jgi:catecholate siderophore receptor